MAADNLAHDIFLLMLNLSQIRSRERVIEVFVDAMNNLHSAIEISYSISNSNQIDVEFLPITTIHNNFGSIQVIPKSEPLPGEIYLLLRNATRMLAIILENLYHHSQLSDENIYLSSQIEERMVELEESNEQLEVEIWNRQKTEKALRDSEARYRLTFDHIGIGIAHVLPTGEIVKVNPQMSVIFDFSENDLLGMDVDELNPPDVERNNIGLVEQVTSQEIPFITTEERFTRKNGEVFWGNLTVSAVFDTHSEVDYYIVVIEDITDKKIAEKAARKSEYLLIKAQRIAHLGSFEYNIPEDTSHLSEELINIFGLSAVDQNDRNWLDLLQESVRKGDFERLKTQIQKVISEGTEFLDEIKIIRPDGEERFVSIEIISEPDQKGSIVHLYGTVQDITKRKLAEQQLQRQLDRLDALRTVDITITSSMDINVVFNVLLDQVVDKLGVDAAAIVLVSAGINSLEYVASRGFQLFELSKKSFRITECLAGQVVLLRKTVQLTDLGTNQGQQKRIPIAFDETLHFYLGVPLIAKGEIRGVLEIYNSDEIEDDPEWWNFLEMLATQTALAIDNATLFRNLQRSNIDLLLSYDKTLESWAQALELRGLETQGHTKRVTDLAIQLARAMGINGEDLIHIRRGSLLHDIGKMGIPDEILLKRGPLDVEERRRVEKHPDLANQWLTSISFLKLAKEIPYAHHEKWDGSGYPNGLSREQIPLAARIFAVVDIWDTLSNNRPYQSAWTKANIIDYLVEQRGKHFDPQVVDVFLEIIASLDS